MFKDAGAAPPALVANLRHNKVLHALTMLVSVEVTDAPRVAVRKRARYTVLAPGIVQVRLHFGFMESPDVPAALGGMTIQGAEFDDDHVTYFLGRETVTAGKAPGMHPLREELFVLLNRGAANASRFFCLPPDQVLEVGTHVEI
jgi:KUP system potassium uptake protein